jgi:hypothetical protein
MDAFPKQTTPTVKLYAQDAPEETPEFRADDTPPAERDGKVMNPTQAAKTWGQKTAERLRGDAAAQTAIKNWAQSRDRAAADDAERVAKDRAAGIFDTGAQDDEPSSEDEPTESWQDEPWNRPDAVNEPQPEENVDPFAQHRVSKPIALELPADVYHVDEDAVADFGHVAVRENWTPEFAQSLVNSFIMSVPKDEKHDNPDRTLSQLRFEFGRDADVLVREVNEFVEKRPALSAWLDRSQVGNSPTAIKLLAAAAREPALLTKAGAHKFIAGLKDNKKYAAGDKLEVAKARLAFTVTG